MPSKGAPKLAHRTDFTKSRQYGLTENKLRCRVNFQGSENDFAGVIYTADGTVFFITG